jgi:hypothetical protein
MREPLIAYLSGHTPPGAVWQYRQHSAFEFELVRRTG